MFIHLPTLEVVVVVVVVVVVCPHVKVGSKCCFEACPYVFNKSKFWVYPGSVDTKGWFSSPFDNRER